MVSGWASRWVVATALVATLAAGAPAASAHSAPKVRCTHATRHPRKPPAKKRRGRKHVSKVRCIHSTRHPRKPPAATRPAPVAAVPAPGATTPPVATAPGPPQSSPPSRPTSAQASVNPFSPTSFWNAALSPSAPLDPNSAGYVNELMCQVQQYGTWMNTYAYSVPVYVVGHEQATQHVTLDVSAPDLQAEFDA
ncbi:MAG: hypothetical protein ACRDPA_33965, partial [Solirubrobacteraceae bacterium]